MGRQFQTLYRRFTVLFLTLGATEIVLSVAAIALHSNNAVATHSFALVFESVAALLAAILIFLPLDATRKSCRVAFMEASAFNPSIPQVILVQRLANTDTLWFPHPLRQCPLLTARLHALGGRGMRSL